MFIECCCCGDRAREQCLDHDEGYGVCDRCCEEYGRKQFCKDPSCKAHDIEEGGETDA